MSLLEYCRDKGVYPDVSSQEIASGCVKWVVQMGALSDVSTRGAVL